MKVLIKHVSYIICYLIIVVTLQPQQVFAVCSKLPRFSARSEPYITKSIEVPVECSLILEAGVHLTFKPNTQLSVFGSLTITGSVENPVVLKAEQPIIGWKGLVGFLGSQVSISHLTYSDSHQGMRLDNPPTTFRSVHFLDNIVSHLGIGVAGNKYVETAVLQDVWIEERKASNQENIGLTVLGDEVLLIVDGLHIQTPERGKGAVKVTGAYSRVTYNNITFSGCSSETRFEYRKMYGVFPQTTCKINPLPVLFIPGYGTSISFPAMLQAPDTAEPVRSFGFIKALTPGYFTFLDTLKEKNYRMK
jgi:hypothetical protein